MGAMLTEGRRFSLAFHWVRPESPPGTQVLLFVVSSGQDWALEGLHSFAVWLLCAPRWAPDPEPPALHLPSSWSALATALAQTSDAIKFVTHSP